MTLQATDEPADRRGEAAAGDRGYARIERAIRWVQGHFRDQPRLAEVAAQVGLSEAHLHRLFQRWAGLDPELFLQFPTPEEAKILIEETRSLLEAGAGGPSGSSRPEAPSLSLERIAPGEYKARARGLTVRWDVVETMLGPALFATLDLGPCGISFLTGAGEAGAVRELARRWPRARIVHAPGAARAGAEALEARLRGRMAPPICLVLKGTPLQLRVWESLLRIPHGGVAAYSDVARLAGAPSVRAVATAVGQNPVACLVPCHRVIRATGALGEYRWGTARKAALLGLERCASGAA